jgi:protein SCO1
MTRRFANVVLRTGEGRSVRFYDDLVRGRRVLVAFIYTRCNGTCPATSATMARLQALFGAHVGRDILFLSVTLDPEHDGPPELKRYGAAVGAGPGWLFLTGCARDIDELRRSLGVRDPDPSIDRDRTQHGALLTFGNDRTGRWAALPAALRLDYLAAAIRRVTGLPPR